MNKNKQNKQVPDSGTGKESININRYIGAKKIEEILNEGQYIEAFVHTQLGIEKILWDKIVGIFDDEKKMIIRRTIEESREKGNHKYKYTGTYELIKWAHFLRAINDSEFSNLNDFNNRRNNIIHGHGQWWYSEEQYKEALKKGIRFLERNHF